MKKTISLLLALFLLLSLCACGSAGNTVSAAPATAKESYVSYEPAEYEYAADAANGFAMSAAEMPAPRDEEDLSGDTPREDPDKIIYSSDVTVETTDFDGTLGKLNALIEEYGGWVESSSVNGANLYSQFRGYQSSRSASYCLRIPSERFSALMSALSSLGNIPYTYTYTENVTAQYYDTQAHLKAYETQEARLLEMMEIAETVEDIVILEDRLTELRYRIESLQSSLNNWDRRVSYSTVYLQIQEVQEYTPEAESKLSYGQRLWRSLTDGQKGVAGFFKEALLWLVGALPTLVILAVLALILTPLCKKLFRRRGKKARKLEEKNEKNEQ